MVGSAGDQRFLRCYRIRRGLDFKRTYVRRVRASDDCLLVYGCENGLPHPRLGLSVSRKVGSAPTRNRWKRLLREAFRLNVSNLPAGVDLVVIPRPAAEPGLEMIEQSLSRLAQRVARRLSRPDK